MNQIIRYLAYNLVVLTAFHCSEPKSSDRNFHSNSKSDIPKPISDSNFIVKDSSFYGRSFLEGLKRSEYAKTYEIFDKFLVVDRTDTAIFPVELVFGEFAEFEGSADGKDYFLMLKQVNYTTIVYGLATYYGGENTENQTGAAHLQPLFFLGGETDEDTSTGISYLSTEYLSSTKECEFAIRIGKNHADQILVKIKRRCKDSRKNIELEKSPTFRKTKNAS